MLVKKSMVLIIWIVLHPAEICCSVDLNFYKIRMASVNLLKCWNDFNAILIFEITLFTLILRQRENPL